MNDEIGRKFVDWRWFLDQNFGPHVNREMKDALNEVESEIDRIEAQRDELLTELEIACTVLTDIYERESKTSAHGQRVRSDISEIMPGILAAIAKAKAQP